MKKTVLATLTGMILCSGLVSNAQAPDENSAEANILKRDFSRMMDWFPGRYDNQEQVYFEDNLEIEEELSHGRIHHLFVPADLPGFPGNTFYIQQYQNNDPTDVYRQRIYSFEPDFEENAIRLTIYIPKDAKALLNAHEDRSKLEGLKPSDFTTYPGCEVFWTYENDQYHGSMKEGACRVESKRSGKTLVVTDDLQLSKTGIWIRDEAEDTDGNYIYGNKAGVHHKNLKARMFNCWVSPQKEDGEYGFYNNVRLHDQGGFVWLEGEDHDQVGLKMRNVVWPTGNNRASLVLYAYRGKDEERAVSYVWTSPDGDRLAMNLRWMQVSCTLGDTEVFPNLNKITGAGN